MSICWPCANPSWAGRANPTGTGDPVGVCYVCSGLACGPHSGIDGNGKLICAYCAALRGVTPRTSSPGPQGPGGGGLGVTPRAPLPGPQGPGGGGLGDSPGQRPGGPSLPGGGPAAPGGEQAAPGGGAQAGFFPEPGLPAEAGPFHSLEEALHFLPGLYQHGVDYRLPDDLRAERLIEYARDEWRRLYGTSLTSDSVDHRLADAATGLALWAAAVPEGEPVTADERDLPWLVRIPLLRVAVAARPQALHA
jgi:hypothetical protein